MDLITELIQLITHVVLYRKMDTMSCTAVDYLSFNISTLDLLMAVMLKTSVNSRIYEW